VFFWSVVLMKEMASYRNNLPLLFLYLGVAPTGGVKGQVALSSC
jgi:hypothetical protein